MNNNYQAGLNLTNYKLQVVEIAKSSDHFYLENVDEAYFIEPLDIQNDKETKILSILQGAFNELVLKKSITSSLVSFTLPAELFYVLQVPYESRLLYSDLIENYRRQFAMAYPYIPSKNLSVKFFNINKNNYLQYETAVVAAIDRRYLVLLNTFCSSNNLTLKFIDNVHLASKNSIRQIEPYQNEKLTLSVYVAAKNLSIMFSLKGEPIYYRLIPINVFPEILGYLRKEIIGNEFLSNVKLDVIDSAYITGEGISQSIADNISNDIGLKFNLYNPFEKITPSEKVLNSSNYFSKNNSFASSAGISFRLA
jgi:Tfp pilus assembly PilM family ATPase